MKKLLLVLAAVLWVCPAHAQSTLYSNSTTGFVGIGTASPVNLLDIGTSGGIHIASGVPVGTSMALYNNSGTLTWNGVVLATGSSVSGTTNYVPVFTGASSLGNSIIYQSSGGFVGIGTTAPLDHLFVQSAGDTRFGIKDSADSVLGNFGANSGGIFFTNEGSGPLQFYTGGVERLHVAGGGNIGIATASPSYTLQVNGSVAGTSAYVNTSDGRLKKNVLPLDVGLNIVTKLKPVTFEWKDEVVKQWKGIGIGTASPQNSLVEGHDPEDPAMQGKQIGFIAQDVEKILPSVVVTEANAEKTKGMKYSELIPVLVKAVQEQQAEIDELKKMISTMKSKGM